MQTQVPRTRSSSGFLAPVLNVISLIGLYGGYLYVLFNAKKSGTAWYTERISIQGHNHFVIFLLLGALLVGLSAFLVRNPFKSIQNGIFRVPTEALAFFALTSALWIFSFDINYSSSRVTEWVYFTPICIFILMVTADHPYRRTLRRIGLFTLLVVPYLAFWSLLGFHTTLPFEHSTIYYSDFWTNILEIGYWTWSVCMFLACVLLKSRASKVDRGSPQNPLVVASPVKASLGGVLSNWPVLIFGIISFLLALTQVPHFVVLLASILR